MSLLLHCDECNTWGREIGTADFIHITEQGSTLHFCAWDCVLRHGSRREPMITKDFR